MFSIEEEKSIKPQRLTFLQAENNCQFCDNPKGPIYCHYTCNGSKMGFVTCEKCCEAGKCAVNMYMKHFAYGEANYLINKTFQIKRSSGKIESGWKLDPWYTFVDRIWDENRKVEGNAVYCSNYNDTVSKCILISDLIELNPK